ncbi:MAG: hypothetical protein KAV42_03080 [Candidatus Krumholzibacteria bacterium]|nr:hypothetical protein [Candidatus Krumholzibacteria bacterium]
MQLRRSVLIALMVVLFIYFEIHSCSDDNTVAPEPGPDIPNLIHNANSIFFLDSDHGWVAGQEGTILVTVNGGIEWVPVKVGDEDLKSISFLDHMNGWLVGKDNSIYNSDDGGLTWNRQLFPSYSQDDDFFDVLFFNSTKGFVLGYPGVFVTEDGGVEWQNNWLPVVPARGAWDMSLVDEIRGYLLGSRWTESDPELLYRTDDGGLNWWAVEGSNASILRTILTIEFLDMSTGWAGGGMVLKTVDGGSNWQVQLEASTVREFDFIDQATGFAVGGHTILKTIDGGSVWTDITPEDERIVDLRSICFLDAMNGWVTGRGRQSVIGEKTFQYSVIMSTGDGGSNWDICEFAWDITGSVTGSGDDVSDLP